MSIDESGRKWLTPDIPYDVFPGLPSDEEIAAAAADRGDNDGPMALASIDRERLTSPAVEPESPFMVDSEGESSPAASEADWETLLPLETLQAEMAAVRNSLGERLLTVANYNASYEQVALDGWLMSALATIAAEHSAPISWKSNALLARDAAVGVAMAATARGRQNFNEAQRAGEQLIAVLDNNPPADLPSPDASASREETADRASLMQRMQIAAERLREVSADPAALQRSAAEAERQARILAALARFTAHPDYSSADEPEYQTAANELVSAGLTMASAAESDDHATFRGAFDRVNTTCNRCLEKFRFGN